MANCLRSPTRLSVLRDGGSLPAHDAAGNICWQQTHQTGAALPHPWHWGSFSVRERGGHADQGPPCAWEVRTRLHSFRPSFSSARHHCSYPSSTQSTPLIVGVGWAPLLLPPASAAAAPKQSLPNPCLALSPSTLKRAPPPTRPPATPLPLPFQLAMAEPACCALPQTQTQTGMRPAIAAAAAGCVCPALLSLGRGGQALPACLRPAATRRSNPSAKAAGLRTPEAHSGRRHQRSGKPPAAARGAHDALQSL